MQRAVVDALQRAPGERPLSVWPDVQDPATIRYAIVWQPPPAFFDDLVSLEAVFALSAGVDHLLRHPGLPAHVPIIRLEDAGMGRKMAEYVLYGVLHAHRRWPTWQAAAQAGVWCAGLSIPSAGRFRIGILGAGTLATAVAERLVANGYPVTCWARRTRAIPAGVACVSGSDGLDGVLATSDVLVCLLPLTQATTGILDAGLLARLPEGAFLFNVARGEHLVETDLLEALDRRHLSGALLDVFIEEPLPASHPFWQHPRVLVTPHIAAPSGAKASAEQVVDSLIKLEAGDMPGGLVERDRGY